jgi:hypothetical protein
MTGETGEPRIARGCVKHRCIISPCCPPRQPDFTGAGLLLEPRVEERGEQEWPEIIGGKLGMSFVGRPKGFLSVLICVHLWLKNFMTHAPENPSNSLAKICENPCKIPHRQPSSTLNFFSPRPSIERRSHPASRFTIPIRTASPAQYP